MLRRLRLYKGFIAMLLLAVSSIGSLLTSPVAHATSDYDDTVKLVDQLLVNTNTAPIDYTTNYADLMLSACGQSVHDSFQSAKVGGDWAISNHDGGRGRSITAVWSPTANSVTANFGQDSPSQKYLYLSGWLGFARFGVHGVTHQPTCDYATTPTTLSYVTLSQNSFPAGQGIFLNTFDINYPSGYSGSIVPDTSVDNDEDGLNVVYELTQGTSDIEGSEDTDKDGINDLKESIWYQGRNNVFCGTECAYPNPTKKDLYVEVDWMKNPSSSRSFKPSATQLGLVKDAYLNKGILFHADTGQYGGGNELPTYIQNLNFIQNPNLFDFYDYKNGNTSSAANFNNNRHRVWHYMISGYQFADIPGSSGAAFPGDDDLFISTGHIEDDQAGFGYNSLDIAMAGTIIHELGHTICLSSQAYTRQSAGCQYSGIDSSAGAAYESVMNYDYQMFMVDYSEGLNGAPNDHNDWSAVLSGGLKDFTDMQRNDGDAAGLSSKPKKEKKLARGIKSQEAKELRRQGRLGGR